MSDYLLFATAFMASAITPGADTLLIATRAVQSKVAAIWSAIGITLAKLAVVTIIYFGIAAVVANAEPLMIVFKVLGAGFLLVRAVVLWRKKANQSLTSTKVGAEMATGFAVGFANPQPFAFYLSVMPSVISGTELPALLAIVAIGFALVSTLYILGSIPLRVWLGSAKNQQLVNRVVSIVFVVLAIWIVLR
jgi:threonine/homoserine/homoserine lactone efflux protein